MQPQTIEPNIITIDVIERLSKKFVVDSSGCWLWCAGLDKDGYGQFYLKGKNRAAHRVFYTAFYGLLPNSLVIDHFVCDTPACVNPKHLIATSSKNNILRGVGFAAANARKTHCKNGHEFNKTNTKVFKSGKRACITCLENYRLSSKEMYRDTKRRYQEKNKEKIRLYMKNWYLNNKEKQS